MGIFHVSVRELHIAHHEVEADSAEAAIASVEQGEESTLVDLEYVEPCELYKVKAVEVEGRVA
jgi:hypothetical protein